MKREILILKSRRGQTALSTIFLIGGIIVLLAVSLALIALSFVNSAFGFQAANRALAIAMGGSMDAELQLARNKSFASAGYCVPAATIPCPAGSATVSVTQNSPETGRITVQSEATVSRRHRKIQVILSVSSSTTEVNRVSYQILTL